MSNKISGLYFPLKFGPLGHFERVTGIDKIYCNLKNIVLTTIEERFMEPTFGSIAFNTIFRNMDLSTTALIRDLLVSAINLHEPRVRVIDIQVKPSDSEDGLLEVAITFQFLATGQFNDLTVLYEVTKWLGLLLLRL